MKNAAQRRRWHPAWGAATMTFFVLTIAAGARAAPSALIEPLQAESGWSTAQISTAITVNLLCYG